MNQNYYSPSFGSPNRFVGNSPQQSFVSPNNVSPNNMQFRARSFRNTPYSPRPFNPYYSKSPSQSPRMFNSPEQRQRNSYGMSNSYSPDQRQRNSYGMRNSYSPNNHSNRSWSSNYSDSSYGSTPGSVDRRKSGGRGSFGSSGDSNPGHCSDIRSYVKPSMLEDPWKDLEEKMLNQAAT